MNRKYILLFIIIIIIIALYFFFFKAKKISFDSNEVNLLVGEELNLAPTTRNIDERDIIWTSSDIDIVSVENGYIKALNKGEVIITASISNTSSSIKVIVKEILPESIKLKDESIIMVVGEERFIDYEIMPSNVTNKEIKWEISNEDIIVAKNGKIKALRPGDTKITLKTINGLKNSCLVHVERKEIPITDIRFTTNSYSLYINENITLKPIVLPIDTTDTSLKWESSDNTVAKVENGIVTGLKKGNVTIKVSDSTGKIESTVNIIVLNKEIIINPSEITIIGDSRMVGLCGHNWYKNEGGTCIAKVSMGYNWLVDTAIPSVNNLNVNSKKNIVVNLGVNDLGHIDKYINKYRELANTIWKDYHLFLLSVNPTSGSRSDMNSKIQTFNNKMQLELANIPNITYCDSYNYLKINGFESGDGLHYRESTSKVIYEQIKKCIYDYYNN